MFTFSDGKAVFVAIVGVGGLVCRMENYSGNFVENCPPKKTPPKGGRGEGLPYVGVGVGCRMFHVKRLLLPLTFIMIC